MTIDTIVVYDITLEDFNNVEAKLPPVPYVPRESTVLILGTAPIWRYAMALERIRKTPFGVAAFRHPDGRGYVVVASELPEYRTGDRIEL